MLRNITWQPVRIATARAMFNIRTVDVAEGAGALAILRKREKKTRLV
jgi:hypothetical protein